LECKEHEISITKVSQNIQEFRNCSTILCFKQIPRYKCFISYFNNNRILYNNVTESEKNCKLCGKLLSYYSEESFRLCSNCYLISFERIESTLTKKLISIIYLPWWENRSICYCSNKLIFTSNCQKYCDNCFLFFIGCRYCLTTNIIFGYTNQTQCKKCQRVSTIIFDITKFINTGNSDLDDFLVSVRSYEFGIAEIANDVKNIFEYFFPSEICNKLFKHRPELQRLNYIPYSQFTNVKKIAEGGYGIVHQATWLNVPINNYYFTLSEGGNEIVILKRFKNSQYFLNEVSKYFKIVFILMFVKYFNYNLEIIYS